MPRDNAPGRTRGAWGRREAEYAPG